MFEELADVVEGMRVPAHGDAIAEARRHRDALDAAIAEAEVAYARAHTYEVEGFGSMAAFLRHRTKLSPADAHRAARRAERLAAWPDYLEAWRDGTLTGTQIDVTVALVPDTHVERFAATAADTARILSPLTLPDTRQALRVWVDRADAAADREAADDHIGPPAPDRARELFWSRTLDDVAVTTGHLDTDSAAVIDHALTAAHTPDINSERRTPAQRRADALVAVCQFYNDHHTTLTSTRRQERLTITCDILTLYRCALRGAGVRTAEHLDAFFAARPHLGALERGLFTEAFGGHPGVARTLDGNPISDGLLSAISAGGTLERLLTVESRIIDHGRAVRTHTPSQWRALAARDHACRMPGCGDPPDRCIVHHVERWEHGGHTDTDHAVLLSPHCHTLVHQPGWADHIEPDGTYTTTSPGGQTHTSRPPGADPPRQLPLHTTAQPARPLPYDPTPMERDGHDPDDDPAEIARQGDIVRQRARDLTEQRRAARADTPQCGQPIPAGTSLVDGILNGLTDAHR